MTTWTVGMDGTEAIVYFGDDDNFWPESMNDSAGEAAGGKLVFQHGPIAEVGHNGTTIETVISVLINRLEGFQRGPFANDYNQRAIDNLRLAKDSLEQRTKDRQSRGVEGFNKA